MLMFGLWVLKIKSRCCKIDGTLAVLKPRLFTLLITFHIKVQVGDFKELPQPLIFDYEDCTSQEMN